MAWATGSVQSLAESDEAHGPSIKMPVISEVRLPLRGLMMDMPLILFFCPAKAGSPLSVINTS